MQASSSNGRASDSKSGCWGFKSLLACQIFLKLAGEYFPVISYLEISRYRSIMARLLRKKIISSKKKVKQDSTDTTSTSQETGNDLKKFVSDTDTSAETKKIQTIPQKKILTGTKTLQDKEINSYLDRVLQFLREVKIELKKVTWPSRKQAVGSTVVVIILVIIISLFLGVVDIGLSSLVHVVLQ